MSKVLYLGRRLAQVAGIERWLRVVLEHQLAGLGGVASDLGAPPACEGDSSTSRNAMSMPLDTPAAVMIRSGNCSTTRCGTYCAPNELNNSWARQCVVAVKPASRPAAASTGPPVHTDVVNRSNSGIATNTGRLLYVLRA
jgi:hypothetical protein